MYSSQLTQARGLVLITERLWEFQALADTDRELLPLLECFMTLAHQLGE